MKEPDQAGMLTAWITPARHRPLRRQTTGRPAKPGAVLLPGTRARVNVHATGQGQFHQAIPASSRIGRWPAGGLPPALNEKMLALRLNGHRNILCSAVQPVLRRLGNTLIPRLIANAG